MLMTCRWLDGEHVHTLWSWCGGGQWSRSWGADITEMRANRSKKRLNYQVKSCSRHVSATFTHEHTDPVSHKHTLTWTNDITPNMLPDIKPPPGAVSSEALNHLLKVFSTFTSQQSREGLEAQHYMTCSWIICVLIGFLLSSHRESKAIFFLVSVLLYIPHEHNSHRS